MPTSPQQSRFQRARRPQQKAERRGQILIAARALLASADDLGGLSLTVLAHEAGMAKSNIYRYFESREAVLLEVLKTEWAEWVEDALAELVRHPSSAENVARVLAKTASDRPVMCQLVSAMPSVLEHNVTVGTVAGFKANALGLVMSTAQALHDVSPVLSPEGYAELLHHVIPFMVGLWPLAHPSAVACEVLAAEEMAPFRHNFERDIERVVTLLIRGLQQHAPEA